MSTFMGTSYDFLLVPSRVVESRETYLQIVSERSSKGDEKIKSSITLERYLFSIYDDE